MKARPQMLAGGNDIYAETGMDQPAPKKPLLHHPHHPGLKANAMTAAQVASSPVQSLLVDDTLLGGVELACGMFRIAIGHRPCGPRGREPMHYMKAHTAGCERELQNTVVGVSVV